MADESARDDWTGWWAYAPLGLALLLSVTLLTSVVYMRMSLSRAARAVTWGQGEAITLAARARFRLVASTPNAGDLEEFVTDLNPQGLRYAAILQPGVGIGPSAGKPEGIALLERGRYDLKERVRIVRRLPTPRRSRPFVGPPRRPTLVIFEFEPLAARKLAAQGRALLYAAILTVLAMLALAVAFSRLIRQRSALRSRLERNRRFAELGQASSVLAHELRNPLAALKGHAQLLEESLPEPDRSTAGRIVSEAQRIENLSTELLDFLRSGRIQPTACPPRELIENAITNLDRDRIRITFGHLGDNWQLDAARMRQALINILENALSADPESPIDVHVAQDGKQLRVTIRDYGPGIAPEVQETLFEPFVTTKTKGTGLGLAVAKRIVEAHGGTLTVSSPASKGACFHVTLPEAEG